MNIRVVVVDDDHKPRALLIKALHQYFPQVTVVAEANSVQTAIDAITEYKPDVVFLDVDLTYGTGFDVLDAFDDPDFAVLFVTAFEHYAIKAIEYSAVGYIVKPIDPEDFQRKVQRTFDRLFPEGSLGDDTTNSKQSTPTILPSTSPPLLVSAPISVPVSMPVPFINPLADKLVLPSNRGRQLVEIRDIVYCEAQSNYTNFYLTGTTKPITVAKTLKEFEETLLPKGFFRIHRSHLVNLAHLKEVIREGNALFVRLSGVSHSIAVARMFHDSLLDRLP